jgi:Fe-S cluster biogenesis protein NfuA
VTRVRLVWPAVDAARAEPGNLAERVQRVLEAEVNPAVAAHGGHVVLVEVVGGMVRIKLEGGCQGCGLAEVTVRQGIERLLRARVPEVTTLADTTDHEAGTEPFFTPGKR